MLSITDQTGMSIETETDPVMRRRLAQQLLRRAREILGEDNAGHARIIRRGINAILREIARS